MTERIRRTYELPQSRDAFLAGLASKAVVQRRSEAGGLGGRVQTHEATDDAVRIVVTTDIPLEWLPGAITARLSSSPTVQRHEEWVRDGDGARSPLTFSFSGLPVTCSGDARLTPDGAGTRLDVDLTMRVDVPLLGGVVERAVAPQIWQALDAEAQFYRTT